MNNPCKGCLVSPMCQVPCDDMIDHFLIMLEDYDPTQQPIIHREFPKEMCIWAKKNPNRTIEMVVEYETCAARDTNLIIEGGMMKIICERELSDGSM